MQKDFIKVTPDTGGGNGTINVTASKKHWKCQKYSYFYSWFQLLQNNIHHSG